MANEKTLNILTHLLGLIIGFIGPLIMYFVTEGNSKNHAKAALNWQLSFLIYYIVSMILVVVVIGAVLMPIVLILDVVFIIIATVKASKGELWKYPLSIPFFKLN